MQYSIDHDLHIHTHLSSCSQHPQQTTRNILQYAQDNGFGLICVTDHYWDETIPGASDWYAPQNTEHIRQSLPLPQAEGVKFLFGCETELRRDLTLGITRERFEALDFVIIPTTHLHMNGFTVDGKENAAERAALWCERLDAVLSMDLPFHKIGIAHPVCSLIAPKRKMFLEALRLLPEKELRRLFSVAAEKGVGIELNAEDFAFKEKERETVLRPLRIARDCGCRFYCGSDAHNPQALADGPAKFRLAVDALELTEEMKFRPGE